MYGTMAPSSTTPLCNILVDNMPNVVLQSPIGHSASLSSTIGLMTSLLLHGNATSSCPCVPLTPSPSRTTRPSPLTPTTTTWHMEQTAATRLPTTPQPTRKVPTLATPRPRQEKLSLTHNQPSNDATPIDAQSHWRLLEVLYCEARKAIDIHQEDSGISVQIRDRWLWVMEMCRARGVYRSKEQCKSKYERVHGLYVRIYEYKRRIPSSCNNYWQMDTPEHHQKGDEEGDTLGADVDPIDANDPQTPSNQHTGEQSRCFGATKATTVDGESGKIEAQAT
ncbi:hypothetical protein L7F22_047726 [Adiantum nelumboides]|nr:hypothetical protein [Adiantum nelumboides]